MHLLRSFSFSYFSSYLSSHLPLTSWTRPLSYQTELYFFFFFESLSLFHSSLPNLHLFQEKISSWFVIRSRTEISRFFIRTCTKTFITFFCTLRFISITCQSCFSYISDVTRLPSPFASVLPVLHRITCLPRRRYVFSDHVFGNKNQEGNEERMPLLDETEG